MGLDGRGISALVIAVTIGAVFFVPVADVVNENTGEIEVTDETVTTDAELDEAIGLTGYDIIADSETVEVYDEADDSWTVLDAGTDYEIDEGPGDITLLSGGAVEEGDEVRASYDYEATDGATGTVAGLLPLILALLLLVPLANRVSDGV